MKRIFFILLLILSNSYSAQLVFGGPELKYTIINGQDNGLLIGARGGAYINDGFFAGAELAGLVSDIKVGGTSADAEKYIGFGYGGILIGTHFNENLIATILLGAATISKNDTFTQQSSILERGTDAFVCEIGIEYKLANTSFGLSYRFLDGWTDSELTEPDLSSINLYLAFDFGKLNFKL